LNDSLIRYQNPNKFRDAATGLLYVGNGQYYDPSTGRFLTRHAKPDQTNPYVPWNPSSALLAPLALLFLFYGNKRKRSKWDTLVIMLLLGVAVTMSLAACGAGIVNEMENHVMGGTP
jgi:hypothetical protein